MKEKREITQQLARDLFDYRPDGALIRKVQMSQMPPGSKAGYVQRGGYVYTRIDNQKIAVHRLIYLWHHGHLPTYVDHIDRNPFNNRIENLRAISAQGNATNTSSRRGSSSKYLGVSYHQKKDHWRVYCSVYGLNLYLGSYDCEADAATVYNFVAHYAHGEFASLNQPECGQPWLDSEET